MSEDLSDMIYIDVNSNLYIKNFWVYIDKDDNIDFFEINNLHELETKKYINKIKTQGLKGKLIDEELDKIIGDGNNDFIDEDDENNVRHYIHNPETKCIEYYDSYYDDPDLNEEDKQPYFEITGNCNLIDNKEFGLSNYEVYYINENTNTPIFYTTVRRDNPMYRISIYTNNTIKLNIIGTKIKTFEITINNKLITSKLINTCYTLNI